MVLVEGLVWSLRPNDIDVELLRTSRELMQSLETETGIHTGWINNGGLFIASSKERLDEYKRLMTVNTVTILTYLHTRTENWNNSTTRSCNVFPRFIAPFRSLPFPFA